MSAKQESSERLYHSNGIDVGSPQPIKPRVRKRTGDAAGLEQSPDSVGDEDDREGSRIGVKRACNECRQQKLRCDVIQDPFQACSRCQRCNLECRIDSSFRRVGKRIKNAEMERELLELRKQLASQTSSPTAQQLAFAMDVKASPTITVTSQALPIMDQYMGSEEAVASLLDLRSGLEGRSFMRSPHGQVRPSRRVENVLLNHERIQDLFQHFYFLYHPFFPLLEPDRSPDHYYEANPLLFWTVIAVAARRFTPEPTLLQSLAGPLSRLLWASLADVPQTYHVVKALCILCTWPLPISSTSTDPTFMLSGVMMQVAMQIGLHRPSHAQDFTKFRVELRAEELRDRVKTWAACNVVAQRVATGYGQPPFSLYDWTLAPASSRDESLRLPAELEARLDIERFCSRVTKDLYSNALDPVGLVDDVQKSVLTRILAREFEELQENLKPNLSSINTLYLRAAGLHLRLSAFFDSPTTRDYHRDLLALWLSTKAFLEGAFGLETTDGHAISYATNYILQMIIAAGFALLKLLNSFFAKSIDLDYGKALFTRTIHTIRNISVTNRDLPWRLAEVLAQLWRGGGAGSRVATPQASTLDNSLQLKVRCRMSMSLVFDSVWRWREEFQAKGRGNLESALKNPTNPDSAAESSTSSIIDPGLVPPMMIGGTVTPGPDNSFGESNYEVFDPLNWMLDGLVDFPHSFSGQSMDLPSMI